MVSESSPHLVPAVDRAIQILYAFRHGDESYGVSDLSRMLEINKSTVFDILNTLAHYNFLERDEESKKYRLGPALFHLGNLVGARLTIRAIAQPFLQELLSEFGTTVLLARFTPGGRALVVDSKEPESPIRLALTTGSRLPAGSGVFGAIWQAAQGEPVGAVRRQGYALDDEQMVQGVRAIGVPINDREGRVAAVLAVMDLAPRLSPDLIARLTQELPLAGQRLSERLGAREYPQWEGIWTEA